MNIFKGRQILSIDFGSSIIKLVEGKFSPKGVLIDKSFSIDLPEGIYEDGEILDIHRMGSILEESLKENKISASRVNAIINSSQIITRQITMPKVSFDEIQSILSYQIEDYIPIRPEDYIVQCIALEDVYIDGVQQYKLLLVGIPKDMVESHLNLFRNIQLKPNDLDFQGNATAKRLGQNRLLNDRYKLDEKTIASLDLGYKGTSITIIRDGKIEVARLLDLGVHSLILDIENKTNMGRSNIKDILSSISINEEYEIASKKFQVRSILDQYLSTLLDNIDMVFRYYRTRDAKNRVDLLVLQGGIAEISNLEARFESYFGIESARLLTLDQLDFNQALYKYSNAIGGLIRMDGV